VPNSFAYCYHSVNVISFSSSQSDHIKRLTLYSQSDLLQNNLCLRFLNFFRLSFSNRTFAPKCFDLCKTSDVVQSEPDLNSDFRCSFVEGINSFDSIEKLKEEKALDMIIFLFSIEVVLLKVKYKWNMFNHFIFPNFLIS
jgi:hypothetical protein